MLDRFVYGAVNRISPEGPIPVFEVDRLVDSAGGAANVAAMWPDRRPGNPDRRYRRRSVAEHLRGQIAMAPSIEARLVMDSARPTTVKTRYVADGQQVLRADREVRAPMSEDVEARVLGEIKDALAYAECRRTVRLRQRDCFPITSPGRPSWPQAKPANASSSIQKRRLPQIPRGHGC